ncbi:MAG TPA: hypothetical protein DET40_11350 [Lentisphaeria bacterium]|nr:MAG: hypothetical protein A2X45_19840 [Lentisphaerae bacterium GWF2_50_93]HCE44135.1 hypothetical protein [Lentisphaeria bacterium]
MKILYIFFHKYGDMPYHTREWVEAAAELGHEIEIVTSIDPVFLAKIGWDGKFKVVQTERPSSSGISYVSRLLKAHRTIKKHVREMKPDIIYERFSLISPSSVFAVRKSGIPYAVEINGILDEELKLSENSRLKLFIIGLVESYVYKNAGSVIAVTAKIRDWIESRYHVGMEKIKIVPNGVNESRFHPYDMLESRKKFKVPENAFIVGYLGSLFEWQDIDILMDTAGRIKSSIPEVHFMIGGGQEPIWSRMKKRISDEGLGDLFTAPGQIPWDDAAQFISCFNVAASTLKFEDPTYEVSPLKLASYMACERPVIGTNYPGVDKLLIANSSGIVYEKGDRDSFVDKVKLLYGMKEEERAGMGKRGRAFIERNLTWKKIVGDTIGFINDRSIK